MLYPTFHSIVGNMKRTAHSQRERAAALLSKKGMVRHAEFTEAGIAASTIARMAADGVINRLSRGLYQLADAPLDTHHSLAEAAKLVPRGVICLVSALAFHELTDTISPRIWIAIGPKDRKPSIKQPPIQFVRFGEKLLGSGIDAHTIESVTVRVTNPARTVVDLFRYRQSAGRRFQKSPGLNLALEGLREALRQRKATPTEIARQAGEAGVWKVIQPYLEAMTANG